MGLTKQAKILNRTQVEMVRSHLRSNRNGLRNEVIFLLSVKSGLRAKEIAKLRWIHLVDSNLELSQYIHLPNSASKGLSGRQIPINKELMVCLMELYGESQKRLRFDVREDYVIRTERSSFTSSQAIVNFFHGKYKQLGLVGCSSHSGRRTFITNVARKISTVGGSMRDVQMLAGHSSLNTTQRYVEGSSKSKVKVVNLI
jgi:integrase/recombinase XerD